MRTWHDQPGFLHGEGGGVIMRLNTLSPAAGSKPEKKRVGRGIGSGLGKTVVAVTKALVLARAVELVSGSKAAKCR